MDSITWDDFQAVHLVAGTIVRVELFPEARQPAYKIWVDFGMYGEKKTSAQLTQLYAPNDLIGKQIIGVINFPEKQIASFRSQFLLSGFYTEAVGWSSVHWSGLCRMAVAWLKAYHYAHSATKLGPL